MLETLHSKLKLTTLIVVAVLLTIASAFGVTNFLYYIINDSYNAYFKTEAKWSLSLMIYFIVIYVVGAVVVGRQNKNQDEFHWYRFFFFFLILVLLANTVFAIYLGVTMKPSEKFKSDLQESVRLYNTAEDKDLPLDISKMQTLQRCCGFKDFDDYIDRPKRNTFTSCCPKLDERLDCTKKVSYPKGCWQVYEEAYSFFKVLHVSLLGASVAILLLGIVAMVIFSWMHSDA